MDFNDLLINPLQTAGGGSSPLQTAGGGFQDSFIKRFWFSEKMILGHFLIGYLHDYWSDEGEPYRFEKF